MTTQTAESIALELEEEIDGFPQATTLERKAAAMLRNQAAEIERLIRCIGDFEGVDRRNIDLLAEIERLTLDAERYRWLRKKVGVTFDTSYPWVWLPTGQSRIDLSDEMKTDAAIDAARAALGEGK